VDAELRSLERRVSPDDEATSIAFDRALVRAGYMGRPELRLALLDCLTQYLKKRPLDTVIPIDPDTPLSSFRLILNTLVYRVGPSGTDPEFIVSGDGRSAIVRFSFALDPIADVLDVLSRGPLGDRHYRHRIVDPRPVTCRVCDYVRDQNDHCLCTVGMWINADEEAQLERDVEAWHYDPAQENEPQRPDPDEFPDGDIFGGQAWGET
jgi:hypothetical protein